MYYFSSTFRRSFLYSVVNIVLPIAARPYVDKAIELTEKFDGIAGLWSPECPNIKSAMDEKQLQLAERAYRLAYPDFVDKEDGSLIKNPAAYRKLCKESITTNRRKSYTLMTEEELLGELATMPKDELVKEFIENIGYQRALTSSNQVLRSDNDLLLRRMKQKMN